MTSDTPTGPEHETSTAGSTYYVLGDSPVANTIVKRLQSRGHTVAQSGAIDDRPAADEDETDPAAVQALEDASMTSAPTIVVATTTDHRNLLIAQRVRTRFETPRIVVLVNDPDRLDLFEAAGHEPVCATTPLVDALVDIL